MHAISDTNGLVRLAVFENQMESEMVRNVLESEGIPVRVQDRVGVGGYMKILCGISVFGEILLVRQEDYPRAREILFSLHTNWENAIDDAQPEALDDADTFEEQELLRMNTVSADTKPGTSTVLIPIFLIVAVLAALLALRLQGIIPSL